MIKVEKQQHGQIVPEAHTEFLQGLGNVIFDCFLRNSQFRCYFLVGYAFEAAKAKDGFRTFSEMFQSIVDDFPYIGLIELGRVTFA